MSGVDNPSPRSDLAPLPAALHSEISSFAPARQGLEQFQRLWNSAKRLNEIACPRDVFAEDQLHDIDCLVEGLVKKHSKQHQHLNCLGKDPVGLRPYEVWLGFGTDAIKSRCYMQGLCKILPHCELDEAVRLLDQARKDRQTSRDGGYKGVSRASNRAANDVQRVMEKLGLAVSADRKQSKKRKRADTTNCVEVDDFCDGDTGSDSDLSIELPRGSPPGKPSDDIGATTTSPHPCEDGIDNIAISWMDDASAHWHQGVDGDDQQTNPLSSSGARPVLPSSPSPGSVLWVDHGRAPFTQAARPIRSRQQERQGPRSGDEGRGTAVTPTSMGPADEVIDLDMLPDSTFTGPGPLAVSALQSLYRDQWLSTEAVYSVAMLFVPDVSVWFISEPVSTAKCLPEDDRRTKKMRLLQASHVYVVAFVHLTAAGHWTVGVLCRPEMTIQIYDPLHNQQHIAESRQALQTLATGLPPYQCCDLSPEQVWRCSEAGTSLRQHDGFNCGIYALVFAICTMHDVAIPTTICPNAWREALSCGLRARLYHNVDCSCVVDGLLDDGTAIGAPHSGSLSELSTADLSLSDFRVRIETIKTAQRAAQLRSDENEVIKTLVERAKRAKVGEIERLKALRQSFTSILIRMGEQPAGHADCLPVINLRCVDQLQIMWKHANKAERIWHSSVEFVDRERAQLKEQARVVANKEIDAW